jgi:microcystin degradation protein MlrC
MKSFVQRMHAAETAPPILSVSLAHGFPGGDTANTSARMLVVADRDAAAAARLARGLGEELYRQRGRLRRRTPDMEDSLRAALAAPAGPVVVAETSDNCGGGAAGDSTAVLAWLLGHEVTDVCLGPLWDPIAVRFCFEAGEGAELHLRVGGKCGIASGDPLDLRVRITRLVREGWQTYHGARIPLGAAAAIRIAGIDVVLTSQRQQALAVDLFTNLGIDPACRRLVVVKSAQHFRPSFEPLARQIVYLRHRTGGEQPYRHIQRPMWPFDDDPLGIAPSSDNTPKEERT